MAVPAPISITGRLRDDSQPFWRSACTEVRFSTQTQSPNMRTGWEEKFIRRLKERMAEVGDLGSQIRVLVFSTSFLRSIGGSPLETGGAANSNCVIAIRSAYERAEIARPDLKLRSKTLP